MSPKEYFRHRRYGPMEKTKADLINEARVEERLKGQRTRREKLKLWQEGTQLMNLQAATRRELRAAS